MERLIALDTETTGIDPKEGHRIIEVGAVEILNREITDSKFQTYIQPNHVVGDSKNIHGITDTFLKGKPIFSQIYDDLLSYINGATLIIHNAPFDLGFLNNELKLIGINQTIEDLCPVIDTLELSKEQRPGTMHGLDALSRRFGIDTDKRFKKNSFNEKIKHHTAFEDAQILAEVYIAMTGGQEPMFNEEINIQAIKSKESLVKKNMDHRDNITVVYADKDEIILDNNYFKN
tara:strand:- start:27 stop:722 length:696 start_codon:yes stop_codon:yes gene_type:complete